MSLTQHSNSRSALSMSAWEREQDELEGAICFWCERPMKAEDAHSWGTFGERGVCLDCKDKYVCDGCDEVFEGTPRERTVIRPPRFNGGTGYQVTRKLCPNCAEAS